MWSSQVLGFSLEHSNRKQGFSLCLQRGIQCVTQGRCFGYDGIVFLQNLISMFATVVMLCQEPYLALGEFCHQMPASKGRAKKQNIYMWQHDVVDRCYDCSPINAALSLYSFFFPTATLFAWLLIQASWQPGAVSVSGRRCSTLNQWLIKTCPTSEYAQVNKTCWKYWQLCQWQDTLVHGGELLLRESQRLLLKVCWLVHIIKHTPWKHVWGWRG